MSAVFGAVLNALGPSLVLTTTVWMVMRLVSRRSLNAGTRYALWWITLAAVVFLPVLQLLPLPQRANRLVNPIHTRNKPPAELTERPSQQGVRSMIMPTRVVPGLRQVIFNPPQIPADIASGNWPDRIMKIWLIISSTLLMRLVRSSFLLARTKARAQPASPQIDARKNEWLALCRSNRKRVDLLISGGISAPMAAGPSRPAILIPASMLENLDECSLDQIGLHEAAHLARRDDYALVLERVIEALFFLHPAIRWITRQLDLEREIACDDFVVQAGQGSRRYAACLTRVAEIALGMRPSPLAASAIEERSHLGVRVNLLLDTTRHTGTRLLKARLTTASIVVITCACMLARVPPLIARPQRLLARAATAARVQVLGLPLHWNQLSALRLPAVMESAEVQAPQSRSDQLTVPQEAAPNVVQPPSEWFVPVTVQDAAGHTVNGLGIDAFRLFEDGVEQRITRVSIGHDLFKPAAWPASVYPQPDSGLVARSPVSIGIVLDTTAEFDTDLSQSRMAVEQLLKMASSPGDEIFLVVCGDQTELVRGFEEIQRRLPSLRPSKGAAVLDGISMALREIKKARHERRTLWAVSNGGQLPGMEAQYKVAQEIQESGTPVAEVRSLQYPEPWAGCLRDPDCFIRLQILHSLQPGLWIISPVGRISTEDDYIARAPGIMPFSTIPDEETLALLARNEYRIEYTPTNTTKDGGRRNVKVTLAIPEPLSIAFTLQYPRVYHAAFTCERCPNLPPNW